MQADLAMVFMFAGNFAPRGFASCEGQIMSIAQNTALFSLLGTTYGGNGQSTFALPDLRGRTVVGQGQGPGLSPFVEGQLGGSEVVTLTTNQLPSHTHNLTAYAGQGTTGVPSGATYLAAGPGTGSGPNATQLKTYATNAPNVVMGAGSATSTGGGQPISIRDPYLSMFYIITLEGIFPSRN
ncbi:phage tail protein [Mucilaginibacter flavidus]|uniref:phage tail protein n=1 Tax=Mucilaginibacter flavidus TaxID=2949309 RepID=UPI0020940021|nr:tail fiber protein [Mucilaginibacter flavidus]MCO5945388.1 tail fiber protein [Mucilaginibacter flavidus]